MKVVVTGGAGFIGANLCDTLVRRGCSQVVAIDDLSTGNAANLEGNAGVELVEASILDRHALARAFEGAGAIVHLAALPSVPRSLAGPVSSHDVNATGTVLVLEAARASGTGHVIVASSSSVYGANPTLPKSEDLATLPLSPYAASKLATEAYALAYASSYGLEILAFRFFNVFGPLQPAGHAYAAVIPAFVSAALEGRPLTVYGDGLQTRDFTYVGSVAGVLADAVERRVSAAAPVNLAFGSRRSLLDVIEILQSVLGRPVTVQHADPKVGDVRDSQADDTRLLSLFPGVQPVAFETGLAATVEWFERELTTGHPL